MSRRGVSPGSRRGVQCTAVPCPGENTIIEYVDGRLTDEAHAHVASHVAACDECGGLLAAMVEMHGSTIGELAETHLRRETSASRPLARGDTLGRYVIERMLGAGAMGVVYEASDPLLARRVALKLLRPDHTAPSTDGERYERMLREAKALARLAHANVVAVHDVGRTDASLFIAMDYVDGGTLGDWLTQAVRTWEEVLAMYMQAGEGLSAAHDAGLVHRDFKPANVLVGVDGRVFVTDFGLARVAASSRGHTGTDAERDALPVDAPLTRSGALVGSPAYMAPEQLAGQPADARSDLFSFCVALYTGLFGARPFRGETVKELREAILASRVEPAPPQHGVPAGVREILLRGLRPAPEERIQTMRALLTQLEAERASLGLSRAERILGEAQTFFRPAELARGMSAVAVSLLEDSLRTEARARTTQVRVDRPHLPYLQELEVSGARLDAILDQLAPFRRLLGQLTARENIAEVDADGTARFARDGWYPLLSVLRADFWIVDALGEGAAHDIGRAESKVVVACQPFAAGASIVDAIHAVDELSLAQYRLRGTLLAHHDPPLRSAFGHTRSVVVGPREVEIIVNDPFPCAMTGGFLEGLAHHLDPSSALTHLAGPCRKHGATECRFALRWGGAPPPRQTLCSGHHAALTLPPRRRRARCDAAETHRDARIQHSGHDPRRRLALWRAVETPIVAVSAHRDEDLTDADADGGAHTVERSPLSSGDLDT